MIATVIVIATAAIATTTESVTEMSPTVAFQHEVGGGQRVVVHGERVWLRALAPGDRTAFSAGPTTPFWSAWPGAISCGPIGARGSRALFLEACLADPTQVIFVVTAAEADGEPLGLVRLFNIHRREGYAFLETHHRGPQGDR